MDIEAIKKEYDELLKQLSDPELISDWLRFEELSKRKEKLEKIIEKQKEIADVKKQIEENQAINSAGEENELVSLAQNELNQLQEKEKILEKQLQDALKKKDTAGEVRGKTSPINDVIIEIRAGTGGEEASLFAGDLYRMYSKYALSQNWQQKVLDSHQSDLGGFKEIIFEVKGNEVFDKLKSEGGVHRVQRIPKTEKSGRVHTSTASVAVLPKPKKTEIKINPADLKISYFKASGPGGQYVQKTESAVRIIHMPSGLVVASQNERNQAQNKENALSILAARLYEKKEKEEQKKIGGKRKAQIGSAKRAEKIRTYNFPQDRVTDHRIKKSWHDIEGIMEGKIDKIIEALQKNA